MTSYARSFLTLNAHQKPTVGDTKTSVVQDDHMGWLLCDGREIDINTFYFLYQVIGNAYGTPSVGSKFKLPNASGRVPGFVGLSDEKTWTLGDVSGEENHVLTLSEIPSHNHTKSGSTTNGSDGITDVSGQHTHTGTTDAAGYAAASLPVHDLTTQTNAADDTGSHTHTFTTNPNGAHQHYIASNGGNQPHNNMQPTIFIGNMFIYSGKPTYGKYPLPMPQTSPYPIL
jgi:microcystin-dependent protein